MKTLVQAGAASLTLPLLVRGMDFSISAALGFIDLPGIAVLDGLVMVGSIHDLIGSGMTCEEAAPVGVMRRLRPVVMTARVASLGFVPMAVAGDVLPTLYARFGRRSFDASFAEGRDILR